MIAANRPRCAASEPCSATTRQGAQQGEAPNRRMAVRHSWGQNTAMNSRVISVVQPLVAYTLDTPRTPNGPEWVGKARQCRVRGEKAGHQIVYTIQSNGTLPDDDWVTHGSGSALLRLWLPQGVGHTRLASGA